jgi:hypothetical protein
MVNTFGSAKTIIGKGFQEKVFGSNSYINKRRNASKKEAKINGNLPINSSSDTFIRTQIEKIQPDTLSVKRKKLMFKSRF